MDLLERQIARQKQVVAFAGTLTPEAAAAAADAIEGADVDNAAPVSAASILFDGKIAQKIAQARRALDRKANVREHVQKYQSEKLPSEYKNEMEKAVKVAQKVFGKTGTKKKKSKRGVKASDEVRVPLAERKAEDALERKKAKKRKQGKREAA